jgi:hypothetical protein
MLDKVQKPSNSGYYTPSTESFRFYMVSTAYYNNKIANLPEDQAYSKLKDSTESLECVTILLLKRSSFSDKVCQQLGTNL